MFHPALVGYHGGLRGLWLDYVHLPIEAPKSTALKQTEVRENSWPLISQDRLPFSWSISKANYILHHATAPKFCHCFAKIRKLKNEMARKTQRFPSLNCKSVIKTAFVSLHLITPFFSPKNNRDHSVITHCNFVYIEQLATPRVRLSAKSSFSFPSFILHRIG